MPHVDRVDLLRPSKEKYVRKSSRGRSDIERDSTVDLDAERVQTCREFDATAGNVRVIFSSNTDLDVYVDRMTGLGNRDVVDQHVAREDQPLRALTGRSKPALDKEQIDARFGHVNRSPD
jgi:hypothetical protein